MGAGVLPPPVNCFHRLHCERGGYQVIRIVPPLADHQQPLNLTDNKHQTALWRREFYSVEKTCRISTCFFLSNFSNNLTVFLSPVQQIQVDRS